MAPDAPDQLTGPPVRRHIKRASPQVSGLRGGNRRMDSLSADHEQSKQQNERLGLRRALRHRQPLGAHTRGPLYVADTAAVGVPQPCVTSKTAT